MTTYPLHTQIDCIVVNYRSAREVKCLLDSFPPMLPRVVKRLVVVDNASGDDSVAHLQAKINELGVDDWVEVVDAQHNAGFGAGNNVGAVALAKHEEPCEILWLLNPDTLVDQTDLNWALKWFESDPEVGIVGTAMVDDQGQPSLSGRRDLSAIGEFVSNAGAFGVLRRWVYSDPVLDRPGPVDWVSGASLLIRRNVFEQLGGFDEGFFLYFEEVDLCRRVRQAGWKVIYEPRSCIVHLEGSSTGISRTKPLPRYWYESRRRYFVKHFGIVGLWAADFAWMFGRVIRVLRRKKTPASRFRDLWRCDSPVLFGREKLDLQHAAR